MTSGSILYDTQVTSTNKWASSAPRGGQGQTGISKIKKRREERIINLSFLSENIETHSQEGGGIMFR